MSLVRLSTGNKITPHAPTSKISTQYPSRWFQTHPGSKPLLRLKLVTNNLLKTRQILKRSIIDNNLHIDVVKTFLYYYLSNVSAELVEDWTSYNVTIGSKGEEITPLSLVQVDTVMDVREVTTTEEVHPDEDSWMCLYAISIYRLIRARMTDYKSQIANRISQQIKAINPRGLDVSEVIDLYIGWANDRGFNCLVGCIDMFFNKFPDHPLANIRIGTTGSRFKDCAALMSYGYAITLLGFQKLTTLLDWIFIEQVGNELDAIMVETEELDDPYSYFPYQVDLGLVLKSSYSAVANPHFFELVHLTGCLLRSQRSINARHIFDGQTLNILMNAGIIAYVVKSTYDMKKVYGEENVPRVEEDRVSMYDEAEGRDEMIAKTLTSRDPHDWLGLLEATDNQMPDAIKNFIKGVGRAIKEPREGTIDAHLAAISKIL